MASPRIALVTGANQGLGFALAAGLSARLAPEDLVLLTGRDPGRVGAAAAALSEGGARVEGRFLDVREPEAIHELAHAIEAAHGGADIVFSNAASRMSPDQERAEQVDAVVETNNLATVHVLRAFAPRMRSGGRLLVVASSFGTLGHLDPRVRPRFAAAARTLEGVERLLSEWRAAVHQGRAEEEGFPTWLNVPSKVAQVAAVRAVAHERREQDLRHDVLIAALCPGLIDTDASRPWFDDMSQAQSPAEAAKAPLDLALGCPADPRFYGELVRFGEVLPWDAEITSQARVAARVGSSR
jgi:NAD(P)-dependent dehydrogenase (short-subunit alcohol dehydrogenase family)